MRARQGLAVVFVLSLGVGLHAHGAPAHGQRSYIKGVFVGTRTGTPVELIAWAEEGPRGLLRMTGSMDDIPVIPDVTRVLCNLPMWKPVGVMVASQEIFHDHRAERQPLRFATRLLNIYAVEIRVTELEHGASIQRLFDNVNVREDSPGYVFVVLQSDGLVRYYPFRLDAAAINK